MDSIKASIESHLEHRPNKDELVSANILKDTILAPSLQRAASDLEHHLVADALARKTSGRPSVEDLVHQNVLRADVVGISPALQATAVELERAMTKDAVGKLSTNRPSRDELVNHNILKDYQVAPALQAAFAELEKANVTDALHKALAQRPDKEELVESNVLERQASITHALQSMASLDTSLAPSLQAVAAELEKAQLADHIRQSLDRRPPASDVLGSAQARGGSN